MANILGSIFVELKAETQAFVDGMSKASYAARQLGKDVEKTFSGLGDTLAAGLAPFGELGSILGQTLGKVGALAGGAAKELGSLGNGLGAIGAVGGAVAGTFAAVSAGAIALVAHTAESAAKLGELAQSTGVSVEALSGLGFVAKQTGVDSETMTRGLERLNKHILTAATAPAGTISAFDRLGISVKNSDGSLKDSGQVFTEIAGKFSAMQDGAAKSGLAIELFGRAGAELVPALNAGAAGIQGFVDQAKSLGIVLDTETAEAAHKFEQSLNTISAAGEGVALELTKQLLPTLQTVTDAITSSLKNPSSGLHDFIDGVVFITKATITFGDAVITAFKQVALFISDLVVELIGIGDTLDDVGKHLHNLDFSGAGNAAKTGFAGAKETIRAFIRDSEKQWTDYGVFANKIFADSGKAVAEPPKAKGAGAVDLDSGKADEHVASIKKVIAALADQTASELKLAAAVVGSTAEQRLQLAANAASATITKLQAEADRTTGAEHAKLVALIKSETQEIYALTAAQQVAKDAVALNTELRKETDAYAAQGRSLQALVSAYSEGSSAIAAAEIDKSLEKDKQKVADLAEEFDLLESKPGVTAEQLRSLSIALEQARRALENNRTELEHNVALNISAEIGKQTTAFRDQLPALTAVNAALFESAAAQREAQVALKTAQFKSANPGATPAQIQEITDLYKAQSEQAYQGTIIQEAAKSDLLLQYDLEIQKLTDIRQILVAHGADTLAIDAKMYDAHNSLIEQWDAEAQKVGTFGERVRASFNQITLEGQNFAGALFASFNTAISGVEDQLAKLVVTGKANFKQLATSLEESVVKASISKVFSEGASAINKGLFGGAIPGLSGKADGSQSSPFYTYIVDSSGKTLDSLLGGAGGTGGTGVGNLPFTNTYGPVPGAGGAGDEDAGGLSNLFSGLTDKLSGVFSSLTSSLGSIFSKIGSLFGGFLAGGGDVTPGKTYVVGEDHPEFFSPKTAGRVAPSVKFATGAPQVSLAFHVHGVTDADSFKRSQNQTFASLQQQLQLALSRTR